MGMHAGLHALRSLENVQRVIAIEYLIAAQALDLREGFEIGRGTSRAKRLLREHVPFMDEDRVLSPDIEECLALVNDGDLWKELQPFFEGE